MKKTIVMAAMAACMFVSNVFAQKIKGSDTCLPLSQTEAENFINKNKSAKITVTGGGSGVGISALMEGTTDIAMSSRKMKFDEKVKLQEAKKSTKEVVIAYDALAVVVHPSNKVSNLTREQLEGIFTGKIKNWKEVGGADMKIVAYSRETSSGTYEFFKESYLEEQELYERHPQYARNRSHHPVRQPDERSNRLCRISLHQQRSKTDPCLLRCRQNIHRAIL